MIAMEPEANVDGWIKDENAAAPPTCVRTDKSSVESGGSNGKAVLLASAVWLGPTPPKTSPSG